jgi:transcriptional regulator of acetoin/glycerol metabolism
MPLERVRSELFNAGDEWEQELAATSVATFAAAIANAWDVLPDRLRSAERPEAAVLDLASEARRESARDEPTVALALAERAFTAVLTRTASGEQSLASQSAENAAETFSGRREAPQQLVGAYVRELLGQYARHVASREIGTLTEGPAPLGVGESRQLIRQLAVSVEAAAHDLPEPGRTAEQVKVQWRSLIQEAFAHGRALPEDKQ